MRKVYVDIFYCKRANTKKAIQEYLDEIARLDGCVCPSVIMLGSETITKSPVVDNPESVPVYRLFSVQRQAWYTNKIVVNLCRNYYL